MALHQIIYTSCMRGIDGVNDGQQIFSYDRGFSDSKSDAVKALFTFQIPSLEPGQIMTEELAKEMPSAFSYRFIDNGKCAITLNTYLGRDYMGSAGRFGNHLSHSIICDLPDLDIYPCEIYGSGCLRSRMEYEEVNNPKTPDYLPTPELQKGYFADVDSIIDFLGEGENIEHLKDMFIAMCKFKSERKRLVICDQPENIVKWIAALQYTLPLDIAKTVNFTTYEFDPELSPAQICGVVPKGTRYNAQSYIQSGRQCVFDFLNDLYTSFPEKDEPLIDFVDTSMSFSYDSLTEFFDYVINHTHYRGPDENYFNCYLLYSLFSDGLSDVSADHFERIAAFADAYLPDEEKKRLLSLLIENSDVINSLNNEYALKILRYLLKYSELLSREQLECVKQMAVNRIIYSLSDADISESEFSDLYNSVDEIARTQRLSLPAELMNDSNRDTLLGIISGNTVAEWKVYSIIRVMCDYVKDMRLPADELDPDRQIGTVYRGIFDAVYAAGRSRAELLIKRILDSFRSAPVYLTNMAMNIEGYLKDLPGGESMTGYLWSQFGGIVENYSGSDADETASIFAEYDRFDRIYGIYEARIRRASCFDQVQKITDEELNNKFRKYPEYERQYASKVLEKYYGRFEAAMREMSDEDALACAKDLLKKSIKCKVESDYVDSVIEALSQYIQIGKISKEDYALIDEMVGYQKNVRHKPVEGRCLLLATGVYLAKAKGARDIAMIASEVGALSGNKPASLRGEEKTIRKYFDWILPGVMEFTLEAADYKAIYDMFNMSDYANSEFIEYACKESFKKSKSGSNDYADFAQFLTFVFESGKREDLEHVGKYLCKLSKQKLEELDEEMKRAFRRDRDAAHKWDSIRDVAEKTNPLLNNLSGLFKKK